MVVAGPALGCRLATYGSYGGCWAAFRAVGWRPTGLMVVAGPPLGLLWWLLGFALGLYRLATYGVVAGPALGL